MRLNKFISALLIALSTSAAFAGNIPQAANVLQLGGAATDLGPNLNVPVSELPNQILLNCWGRTAAALGDHMQLLRAGAPYQVTAGKTFTATSFGYFDSSGAVLDGFQFLTGTGVVPGGAGASGPPGAIYYSGVASKTQFNVGANTAGKYTVYNAPVTFGPSTWPAAQAFINTGNPNVGCYVIGKELP